MYCVDDELLFNFREGVVEEMRLVLVVGEGRGLFVCKRVGYFVVWCGEEVVVLGLVGLFGVVFV